MSNAWWSTWELFNSFGAGMIAAWLVYVGYRRHKAGDLLAGDYLAPMAFFWAVGIMWGSIIKYEHHQHYTTAAVAVTIGVVFGIISMITAWRRV